MLCFDIWNPFTNSYSSVLKYIMTKATHIPILYSRILICAIIPHFPKQRSEILHRSFYPVIKLEFHSIWHDEYIRKKTATKNIMVGKNPQVFIKYGNSRFPIPITLPARFIPVINTVIFFTVMENVD